jgi:hypothetical protein
VLRTRTGVAGSAAGAAAAARYFLDEALKPENQALAQYYAGEAMPAPETGMDFLGRAVAAGELEYSTALDELLTAHGHIFGYPDDIDGLEARLSSYLLKYADRAERHETIAQEGGTVARVREDLDPRIAERLGINTGRPLAQAELAHLLSGVRADGRAIEGKQIQKPMKSVVDVFGLNDRTLPTAQDIDHVIAGRRADGEAPQVSDAVAEAARRRFLTPTGCLLMSS